MSDGGRSGRQSGPRVSAGLASPTGARLQFIHAGHVPPATEEVIHCLQSQGSPAAAEQQLHAETRATLGTWGGRHGRPLFLPASAHDLTSAPYWRAVAPRATASPSPFRCSWPTRLLAFTLSHDAIAGVRNGADVLLKSALRRLGGRDGLIVFGAPARRHRAWRSSGATAARSGPIEGRVFVLMIAESVVYALLFGLVVGTLTGLLLGGSRWPRRRCGWCRSGPGGPGPRRPSS